MNADKISDSMIEDLTKVLESETGKLSVKIKLIDDKSQIVLKSRKKGISINKEMAERLKRIDNLKFKLA